MAKLFGNIFYYRSYFKYHYYTTALSKFNQTIKCTKIFEVYTINIFTIKDWKEKYVYNKKVGFA